MAAPRKTEKPEENKETATVAATEDKKVDTVTEDTAVKDTKSEEKVEEGSEKEPKQQSSGSHAADPQVDKTVKDGESLINGAYIVGERRGQIRQVNTSP